MSVVGGVLLMGMMPWMTDAERIRELERENTELRRRLDEALKRIDELTKELEEWKRGHRERRRSSRPEGQRGATGRIPSLSGPIAVEKAEDLPLNSYKDTVGF